VRLAATLLALGLVLPTVACSATAGDDADVPAEDCDREDLRGHEDDCGYWAADGAFVLWDWVVRDRTSRPPAGWRPSLPAGGSYDRPANARPDVTRQPSRAATSSPTTARTATTRTTTRTTTRRPPSATTTRRTA
jgi:hypothetical protein